MKPWLLNLLACPICKNHPLNVTFYNWEKLTKHKPNAEELKALVKEIKEGTISPPAISQIIDQTGNKDTSLMLEKVKQYLTEISKTRRKIGEREFLTKYRKMLQEVYSYFYLEVENGLMTCTKCDRWYPIGSQIPGIPEMLPDDLREEDKDIKFLKKFRDKIPPKTLKTGKPFNLG